MNLLKTYIQNFLSRAGSYVFTATIASRALSFIASWIALQFIRNDTLGVVLYAWNIIAFLMPFIGAGLHQSLIRYGALLTNENDKKSLLHYVVKNGTIASIFLTFFVAVIGLLFPFKFSLANSYIPILSLSFIPFFLLETIKIQLRLQHNNKMFAKVDVIYNIILVLLVFILSYLYKENGYITALILAPTLSSVLFFNRIKTEKSSVKKLEITNKEFWKYGFWGGLTGVVTVLLFVIDIFLIGEILENPEKITAYKYVSLIPFSLLFLPRVFIATDFVAFTEKIADKNYIANYSKSYLTLFTLLSVIICILFFIFSENILALFHKRFIQYSSSFKILTIGVCGILIFRGLYGNLLSSIGNIKVNSYITIIALFINVLSNYYLIPIYGIKGAAITSALMMWFSGIASYLWFIALYKNFKG